MILRLQKLTKQYAIDLDAACEPKKRWFGTSPTEDPANAKLFPGTWVGFREHIKEVHRPPARSIRFRAHPSPRRVSRARLILACTPPRPDWRPVCAMAHSAARPVVPRKPRRPSPALRAGRRGPEQALVGQADRRLAGRCRDAHHVRVFPVRDRAAHDGRAVAAGTWPEIYTASIRGLGQRLGRVRLSVALPPCLFGAGHRSSPVRSGSGPQAVVHGRQAAARGAAARAD